MNLGYLFKKFKTKECSRVLSISYKLLNMKSLFKN